MMNKRIATWLAWGMLVASVILILLLQWIFALPHPQKLGIETTGNSPFAFLGSLAFSIVGVLIVSRYPRHPIGWIYVTTGFFVGVTAFTTGYAQYAAQVPAVLPAGDLAEFISNLTFAPAIFLPLTFGLLLFPDGRLPSRRWRPFAWFTALCFVVGCLGFFPILLIPTVVSAVSLIIRWRRAYGEERQQLKWIASAAVLLILLFLLLGFITLLIPSWGDTYGFLVLTLPFMLIPIAAGVAILKYRLYDIDIIIRKTVTYTIVVVLLAIVYFGSVILLQQVFANVTGQRSEWITIVSTLAIAALFVPLRNRIQSVIDKRFYRKKYDAQKVLAKFAETVRDETDLEKLTTELVNVVQETMQPKSVSVWLKPTMDERRTTKR